MGRRKRDPDVNLRLTKKPKVIPETQAAEIARRRSDTETLLHNSKTRTSSASTEPEASKSQNVNQSVQQDQHVPGPKAFTSKQLGKEKEREPRVPPTNSDLRAIQAADAQSEHTDDTSDSSEPKKDLVIPNYKDIASRISRYRPNVVATLHHITYLCRIEFITCFDIGVKQVVAEAWGEEVTEADWEWGATQSRVSQNISNWKRYSIRNMEGKLIEWKENGTLVNMDDYVDRSKPELLSKYFRRHYSPSAFGTIFDFATKAIDVTQSARRNDLIDDYFKCVFSNFAARVYYHMVWSGNPDARRDDMFSRDSILRWMSCMGIARRWRDITPDVWVRRQRPIRETKTNEFVMAPDVDQHFCFDSGPEDQDPIQLHKRKAADRQMTEEENNVDSQDLPALTELVNGRTPVSTNAEAHDFDEGLNTIPYVQDTFVNGGPQ